MRSPTLESEKWLFQAIGTAIRDARIRAGMSQQELARRAEVSRPGLAMIENAYSGCTITNLYAIADGLGVSVFSLIPQSQVAQITNADGRIAQLEKKLLDCFEMAECIAEEAADLLPISLTRKAG